MIIILFCVFVLSNGVVFEGSCPEFEDQNNSSWKWEYKPTLLMPGSSSSNHFYRNMFGHTPDCWTLVVGQINLRKISELWFQRDKLNEEIVERSACFNIFSLDDIIKAKIKANQITFTSLSTKIYPEELPMVCTNELNWRSRINYKTYVIKSEISFLKEINYIVLWSCVDLPNGQYDLGIIAGVDSRIQHRWAEYYSMRMEVLENSLNLVRKLPFARKFSFDDFERAKLHNGIFCDLCEMFRCN